MPVTRRAAMAATLFSGLQAGAGPAFAADAWRMVTEYPATAIPGEGIAAFAENVARLSDQALTLQTSFEAMRSAAMLSAVSDGQVEAADAFSGAMAADAPIFQLSALPFLTNSTSDTARLLTAARPAYVTALAARGATLLYATPWPASGIWSRAPLTAASLRGLRIRTYDAASTDVMRAAGCAPVQISFKDAVPRLRAGDLDAVLSSGDGGAGARLWEILPSFTVLNYASPLSLAFCRTALLRRLPDTVQAAVRKAGEDTEARQFQAMTTRALENEARMRENGVAIAEVAELRNTLAAAAGPVIDAWTARTGPDGSSILEAYKASGH